MADLTLSHSQILILQDPDDVRPFVETARLNGDANRQALGFLPNAAYEETAEQGKLLVAVFRNRGGLEYAGHLLFGGVFPHGRVFQIYCPPPQRRKRVARYLVENLLQQLEALGYLGVSARVASDLHAANSFWEQMGFHTVRQKPGGRSTGRILNIRVRELQSPHLFREALAPSFQPNLQLSDNYTSGAPSFGVDLNVLFDVVDKRFNSEHAGLVFHAAFKHVIKVFVAEEFIREFQRNSGHLVRDPVLEFALHLPRVPEKRDSEFIKITAELMKIIFPLQAADANLNEHDKSDLIHLATAVQHGANGFVTSDRRILRARKELREVYQLDVIGPSELSELTETADPEGSRTIVLQDSNAATEIESCIDCPAAVTNQELPRLIPQSQKLKQVQEFSAQSDTRSILATSERDRFAIALWRLTTRLPPSIDCWIVCDEETAGASSAVDYFLMEIYKQSASIGPLMIRLMCLPGSILVKNIAVGHGFRASDANPDLLQKLCVGAAISESNWSTIAERLRSHNVALPDSMPPYVDLNERIPISSASGKRVAITVQELESLISPAILLLNGRGGAIVPIRPRYSEQLFGLSAQWSLLGNKEAVLLSERAYFSHPRNISKLEKGTPIMFYESLDQGKGQGAIVSCGTVIRTELRPKDDLAVLKRKGVLEDTDLAELSTTDLVAATTFGNIMKFKHPVKLDRLRELGCVDGSNLITAQKIGYSPLRTILEEGFPHA